MAQTEQPDANDPHADETDIPFDEQPLPGVAKKLVTEGIPTMASNAAAYASLVGTTVTGKTRDIRTKTTATAESLRLKVEDSTNRERIVVLGAALAAAFALYTIKRRLRMA